MSLFNIEIVVAISWRVFFVIKDNHKYKLFSGVKFKVSKYMIKFRAVSTVQREECNNSSPSTAHNIKASLFYVGFQFLKPSHYQSAFVAKRDGFEENILSANVPEKKSLITAMLPTKNYSTQSLCTKTSI